MHDMHDHAFRQPSASPSAQPAAPNRPEQAAGTSCLVSHRVIGVRVRRRASPPFWTALQSGSPTGDRADLGDLRASSQAPRRPVASQVVQRACSQQRLAHGRACCQASIPVILRAQRPPISGWLGRRRQIRWPHGRLVAIGRHGTVPRRAEQVLPQRAARGRPG